MAFTDWFASTPRTEDLGDILATFDTVTARLATFQSEQTAEVAAEEAEIATLQASVDARKADLERAARVKERVAAITA